MKRSPPPDPRPPSPISPDRDAGALVFRHPEPPKRGGRLKPVFLPFLGCPGRCLFCDQTVQTGRGPKALESLARALSAELETAAASGEAPFELGFFGGAFTALPDRWAERLTELAGNFKARGLVSRLRCSTRPDAVTAAGLARLRDLGLDLVEIGVQTFADPVLAASGRNHDAATSEQACRTVTETGLALGVQLLPGLPGHAPPDLAADLDRVLALSPECARLYPCLVIAGTPLANMLAAGRYTPWTLDETLAALAPAALRLWRAGVRIIRIGLAPQAELLERIVAGPWSPDLGARVRASALLLHMRELLAGRRAAGLKVPKRRQGEFHGHRRELAPAWAALGLTPDRVQFVDGEEFVLETEREQKAPPAARGEGNPF